MTCRRFLPPSTAHTTAGKASDNDAKEGDDAVNDGVEHGSHGVDNGHDDRAYRAKDGLDLKRDM